MSKIASDVSHIHILQKIPEMGLKMRERKNQSLMVLICAYHISFHQFSIIFSCADNGVMAINPNRVKRRNPVVPHENNIKGLMSKRPRFEQARFWTLDVEMKYSNCLPAHIICHIILKLTECKSGTVP